MYSSKLTVNLVVKGKHELIVNYLGILEACLLELRCIGDQQSVSEAFVAFIKAHPSQQRPYTSAQLLIPLPLNMINLYPCLTAVYVSTQAFVAFLPQCIFAINSFLFSICRFAHLLFLLGTSLEQLESNMRYPIEPLYPCQEKHWMLLCLS